jgi:uncharacterized membrane protein
MRVVALSLQIFGALVCALGGVAASMLFVRLIDHWRAASDPTLKTINHFVTSGLELVIAALVVESAGVVLIIYGGRLVKKLSAAETDS